MIILAQNSVKSKTSKKIIIFFIVSMISFNVFGQGSTSTLAFYSPSLNKTEIATTYLPEGYNPQDSIRYPVIYFLHGILSNHNSYNFLIGILDNLIGDSTISPVIVVKPDANVSNLPWAVSSVYTNSELYGDYEDYIVYDLIEYIDTTYKTIPSKNKRTIMGHSTGGYGAMMLALKHPDIYSAVASHSGHLDFHNWYRWIPTILSQNGGTPVSFYNPNNGLWTRFFYTMAGAFSPNLNNTPYPLDFVLDSLGNYIDSTFNKWLLHDPSRLAHNITPSSNLDIYFDCGIQDEYLFHYFNTAFADSLDSLGITHVYQPYVGDHYNQLDQRFPIALCFLDSVMNKLTNIEVNNNSHIRTHSLYQNYPNPFNPSTTIEFDLSKTSKVTLKVFNILGEEVATLVAERLSSGTYSYEWDASSLASGVYLYRLQAGEYVETRKKVLMR
jgi:S-formylglutathione hydrolase FrmB